MSSMKITLFENGIVSENSTCNFITFWGEGVQNLKVTSLDFNYVKPSFDFKTKGFFNYIL